MSETKVGKGEKRSQLLSPWVSVSLFTFRGKRLLGQFGVKTSEVLKWRRHGARDTSLRADHKTISSVDIFTVYN